MCSKKEFRKLAKVRVQSLSDLEMKRASEDAAVTLTNWLLAHGLKKGTKVGLFLSISGIEIDTEPLLRLLENTINGLCILVPRVEDETTIRFYPYSPLAPHRISKYGIWEPLAPIAEADVPEIIIVPGLAFDDNGGRLGHGKGYYDRYLSLHEGEVRMKVGYALEVQILAEIPVEPYDHLMDAVVTEQKVRIFR